MESRELGLRELCRAVELDPSFLSKVLAGKRNPPSDEDVLRRIATVLEVEPTRLIASAGRIPSEWARLYDDPIAFDRVDQLLRQGQRSRPVRVTAPARSDDFGEELL